eukprot:scaffold35306_cov61-Phaeocystis_antarctica.AAC.4
MPASVGRVRAVVERADVRPLVLRPAVHHPIVVQKHVAGAELRLHHLLRRSADERAGQRRGCDARVPVAARPELGAGAVRAHVDQRHDRVEAVLAVHVEGLRH